MQLQELYLSGQKLSLKFMELGRNDGGLSGHFSQMMCMGIRLMWRISLFRRSSRCH